jgi:hypothetical protein
MKKISSLLLLFLILASNYLAFSKPTPKWHKTTVILTDGQRIKGILFAVTDSTVILIPDDNKAVISKLRLSGKYVMPNKSLLKTIQAYQIYSVQIRRTGREFLGVIGGIYGGGTLGMLLALPFTNNKMNFSDRLTVGAIGLNLGAIVGVWTGLHLARKPRVLVYFNADPIVNQARIATLKPYSYEETWK